MIIKEQLEMLEAQQRLMFIFLAMGYINLHLLFAEDEEEENEDDTN